MAILSKTGHFRQYPAFLVITGPVRASIPNNYFKENITVFGYPEMTILLVLKHGYNNEHFYIHHQHWEVTFYETLSFRLFDSVKKRKLFQSIKLKFYFISISANDPGWPWTQNSDIIQASVMLVTSWRWWLTVVTNSVTEILNSSPTKFVFNILDQETSFQKQKPSISAS